MKDPYHAAAVETGDHSEQWPDMSEASREQSRQALRELRKKRNDTFDKASEKF